jgi:hypothetical protein
MLGWWCRLWISGADETKRLARVGSSGGRQVGGTIPPWGGAAGLVRAIDPGRNERRVRCDVAGPHGGWIGPRRGAVGGSREPGGRGDDRCCLVEKRNGSSDRFASSESERDRSPPRGAETAAQQTRAPQKGSSGAGVERGRQVRAPTTWTKDRCGFSETPVLSEAASAATQRQEVVARVYENRSLFERPLRMVERRSAPTCPTRASNKSTNESSAPDWAM